MVQQLPPPQMGGGLYHRPCISREVSSGSQNLQHQRDASATPQEVASSARNSSLSETPCSDISSRCVKRGSGNRSGKAWRTPSKAGISKLTTKSIKNATRPKPNMCAPSPVTSSCENTPLECLVPQTQYTLAKHEAAFASPPASPIVKQETPLQEAAPFALPASPRSLSHGPVTEAPQPSCPPAPEAVPIDEPRQDSLQRTSTPVPTTNQTVEAWVREQFPDLYAGESSGELPPLSPATPTPSSKHIAPPPQPDACSPRRPLGTRAGRHQSEIRRPEAQDSYYSRSVTAAWAGFSTKPSAVDRRRTLGHVGFIEETDRGIVAPIACGGCQARGDKVCKTYTDGGKCARCRFDGKICSLVSALPASGDVRPASPVEWSIKGRSKTKSAAEMRVEELEEQLESANTTNRELRRRLAEAGLDDT